MYNLGLVYQRDAKYAEAESILAKTAEARRRVLGDKQPLLWIHCRCWGKQG
jgi:hypothetical protein